MNPLEFCMLFLILAPATVLVFSVATRRHSNIARVPFAWNIAYFIYPDSAGTRSAGSP